MYYLYSKFGGFSFSRFGFIVRTNRQTHTHTETESQTPLSALLLYYRRRE